MELPRSAGQREPCGARSRATAAEAASSASAPAGQRQRGRRRRTVPRGACSSRAPCAAPPQSGQRRPGERYYHELPGPPPQSCSSGSGWRHSQGTPPPPPRPLSLRLELLLPHLFLLFLHLLLRPPLPRRGSWPPPLSRPRMPGGKRGLVAPQNTFLENIVRRSSGKQSCSSGHRHLHATPHETPSSFPSHPSPQARGKGRKQPYLVAAVRGWTCFGVGGKLLVASAS